MLSGDRGEFRADQVVCGKSRKQGKKSRARLIRAFLARPPLVLHDVGDELELARGCEELWPSPEATRIRRNIEAERALWTTRGSA